MKMRLKERWESSTIGPTRHNHRRPRADGAGGVDSSQPERRPGNSEYVSPETPYSPVTPMTTLVGRATAQDAIRMN